MPDGDKRSRFRRRHHHPHLRPIRNLKGTPITEEANSVTGVRYNLITDYQGRVMAILDTSGDLAASCTYAPYAPSSPPAPTPATTTYAGSAPTNPAAASASPATATTTPSTTVIREETGIS
ncbi:hypothetical protein GCM10017788_64760 [Amycolatopsis acidiphila]|nr:hypothetical protein GCM10017788_64760 [Amycolatopsis acidiphila]